MKTDTERTNTQLSRLLLWLSLALSLGCSHSTESVSCSCVEPAVAQVALPAESSLVVAGGPCTVDKCVAAGAGGAGPDGGALGCTSQMVRATAVGACGLVVTFADGATAAKTITFSQRGGDCCPGLYADAPDWAPTHP